MSGETKSIPEDGLRAEVYDFYAGSDELRGTNWQENPPVQDLDEVIPPNYVGRTVGFEEVFLSAWDRVSKIPSLFGIPSIFRRR
jgi:hypothetical protein